MIKALPKENLIICSHLSNTTKRCFSGENNITTFWDESSRPLFVNWFGHISDIFCVDESITDVRRSYHLERRWLTYDRGCAIDAINVYFAQVNNGNSLPSCGVLRNTPHFSTISFHFLPPFFFDFGGGGSCFPGVWSFPSFALSGLGLFLVTEFLGRCPRLMGFSPLGWFDDVTERKPSDWLSFRAKGATTR